MAASLLSAVLLLAGSVSGSYIRYSRDVPGTSSGSSSHPGTSSGSSSLAGASSGTSSFPGSSTSFGSFPGASSGTGTFPGTSSSSSSVPGAPSSSGSFSGSGAPSSFGSFPGTSSSFSSYPGASSSNSGSFPGTSSSFSSFPGSSSSNFGSFPGTSSSFSSFPGASSSSFSSASSSSGTNVAPGPGGYGNFNAFAGSSNYGSPSSFPSGAPSGYSGGGGNQMMGSPTPFGGPGFNPFTPQYGQMYPYTPFPTFAAPFDFNSFLNQYFQALQNFQAQAEAQAQQAAASGYGVYHSSPGQTAWAYSHPWSPPFTPFWSGGFPSDSNEVGGVAMATYSPQGGYGSANIFPKPGGGLDTRFGGDEDGGQNSVGPVSSVSGNFKPPSGGNFGVFTSSASGSSDINGKKTSFKQSTIGVNDNGKVTTYTAHDP